jgi:hypothetical protein
MAGRMSKVRAKLHFSGKDFPWRVISQPKTQETPIFRGASTGSPRFHDLVKQFA